MVVDKPCAECVTGGKCLCVFCPFRKVAGSRVVGMATGWHAYAGSQSTSYAESLGITMSTVLDVGAGIRRGA